MSGPGRRPGRGADQALKAAKLDRILTRPPFDAAGDVRWFSQPPQASCCAGSSAFDALKERLKGLGSLYPKLVSWFSPVLPSRAYAACMAAALSRHGRDAIVMNLGSGPGGGGGRPDVINVDCFAHQGVDMVADNSDLPVADSSVDLVLSVAVLEHVPNPQEQVAEMARILRPGGELFCFIPFLQPFHAAPHDFTRLTGAGLRCWFADFDICEEGLGAGPTSALLWIAQHWAAMVLSLGSARAYGILLPALMLATWPIKHLDRLLERHPKAGDAACGFYILARKRTPATVEPVSA
jgi:SAM-dependent methyltransferase